RERLRGMPRREIERVGFIPVGSAQISFDEANVAGVFLGVSVLGLQDARAHGLARSFDGKLAVLSGRGRAPWRYQQREAGKHERSISTGANDFHIDPHGP